MEQETPAFMINEQQPQRGLLQQGRQEQAMPEQMEEGDPASPEEQAQYDKVVGNAMKTLHGDQSDQFVERLAQGEPDEAIAEVTVTLVIKLYESAEQAGKPIMDTVLLHAGEEILNEVINLGVVAGVYDFEEEEGEEVQQEALLLAMDKFGRYLNEQGRFNNDELQEGVNAAESGAFSRQLNGGN